MSAECKMEIHVRHSGIGERKLNILNGNGGSLSSHGIGGGETGDESSSGGDDVPLIHSKKNHKKHNGNGSKKKKNNSTSNTNSLPALPICSNSRDMSDEHQQDDDDEGSRASFRGTHVMTTTSFTSGENSDADGGAEGEDHIGVKQDSRKCFECDVCNMQFSNGANMRRHRMRHTGVKPYECRVCQKRFFRKDHLAEHSATHSKLLPFRCPICNKGFQRQIAMRAHFQNEHVGGSHENMGMKACPLCSYKASSMKSLRLHFRSRHGIDLDNPVPHSPSLQSNERSSPGPTNGEYSELAHALGFEDREKSSDSIKFPSHFLVPQIEIASSSPYPAHFAQFSADSSYGNGSSSPPNVSPHSDSSSNPIPSSSDLVTVVVKKELPDDLSSEQSCNGESKSKDSDNSDDVQDVPEDLSILSNIDLSSGNSHLLRSSQSPKCCSSSRSSKVSALKSLLREDWKKDSHQNNGSNNGASSSSRSRSDSSGHSYHSAQTYEGEDISSSIPVAGSGTTPHSMYSRRGLTAFPAPLRCIFCGIIFPDKTLYFLHLGCHSESNPWKCNICGQSCSNVYDFNSHLLSKSHQ